MAWLTVLGRGAGRLAGQALDLLYPPRCVFCRAESADGPSGQAVVCEECSRRLTVDGPRCPGCGEPAAAPVACRRCQGWTDREGVAVLAGYGDELRAAVLAAKRPGGELQATGLATLLYRRHRESFLAWRIDVVVPVPMHWLRRATRGTSSADLLARHLARCLDLPCRRLVHRIRATRMQNELPPVERPANVRDAFRATAGAAGRRILLVDDVMTTGATLAACRQALLAAGAEAVLAAVAARADRNAATDEPQPRREAANS